MAALSSYHNILMMNQAASKSVVTLLTQGFLPCRGPRGGAGSSEKAFVPHCYLFIKSSAVSHLLPPSPFPSRMKGEITRRGIYPSVSAIHSKYSSGNQFCFCPSGLIRSLFTGSSHFCHLCSLFYLFFLNCLHTLL